MTLTFEGNLPRKNGLYDPANEKDGCGVGFVCDIKGRPSHRILQDAFAMNCCMEHRGGVGYETNTGDGAGIMTGMPHDFLNALAKDLFGRELPRPGEYGVGNIFLPTDSAQRAQCKGIIEQAIEDAGQALIGWRELPTNADLADVGKAARAAMPAFEQLFVGKGAIGGMENESFERKLYTIRKHSAHLVRADESIEQSHLFYMLSLIHISEPTRPY